MEESIAFLLLPDVQTQVQTHPDWSVRQKERLLTLLREWVALNHQYRQVEYTMRIQKTLCIL